MKVVIVGGGLGGLACAIACAREGLKVVILERAPEFLPIGAGIQIPPNGARINRYLGTLPRLMEVGTVVQAIRWRRYTNGVPLFIRENARVDESECGAPWLVIHRADYVDVLLETAVASGVEIRLDAEVSKVDFESTTVTLKRSGEIVYADVIVGADGLWSDMRNSVLSRPSPPEESGDLAYRGVFTRAQLESLKDPEIDRLVAHTEINIWLGPSRHAVFYPLRSGEQFNLVLLDPDDIPVGHKQGDGDVGEMRASISGWDPVLQKLLSCLPSALKWKLCHHKELEAWTKGSVALLGDACHPSLPYQAQGAAMAVEDGAVLGKLLGRLNKVPVSIAASVSRVPDVLKLYEKLRKARTTINVAGAVANRYWFHLHDGPEQEHRDAFLAGNGVKSEWVLNNDAYQRDLLGFDVVKDSEEAFDAWLQEQNMTLP
ncbi:putative salicylate hydroxylase [Plenodomus tracheiphilus IPT5]|uniref:Salicylate hydroxylase n=1 Tax=Plenodomus tracheiphilus IPT5 TaxID=1408161 RepID=A0A6A7AUI3_9PLEO|nr:putative salicylate hydroxylase [Plenodomus tracheiphilus IPT5]